MVMIKFRYVFQSKRVFIIRGGYRRIRKCLRKRGWVEQDYYKNSIKSTNDGGTTSPKKTIEVVRSSGCGNGGGGGGSGDNSDGDTDVNDGGAVSEEDYSDEEEYCMLVKLMRNEMVQKLGEKGVVEASLVSRLSLALLFPYLRA